MDTPEQIFQCMCRACMSKDVIFNSIDDYMENLHKIGDMLATTIPQLFVESCDQLPKIICLECLKKLNIAFQFQSMCIESDKHMRSILSDMEFAELGEKLIVKQRTTATPLNELYREEDPLQTEKLIKIVINFEPEKLLVEQVDSVAKTLVQDNGSAEDSTVKWRDSNETNEEETVEKNAKNTQSQTANKQPCPSNMPNDIEVINMEELVHGTKPQVESLSLSKRFKCSECSRHFEKYQSLSAHKRTHRKAERHPVLKCSFCPKEFSNSALLAKHGLKHPENRKFKCSLCKKAFAINEQLIEHMKKHNGVKPYVCVICNKAFLHNCLLKEHQRMHTDEKPFLCATCGKSFKHNQNLQQHLQRHAEEKRYQCPECPSKFSCQSDQIKHTLTHRGIKPHACDICGARFTRPYTMNKHKYIHTGERPHKCEECNMTFVFIKTLRQHMRTHTGEKPYKCNYCDRDYAESGDLNKHLRTHVGSNTYICDQCPAAFKYKKELREHQSQHYKEQQQIAAEDSTKVTKES